VAFAAAVAVLCRSASPLNYCGVTPSASRYLDSCAQKKAVPGALLLMLLELLCILYD